MRRLLALTLLAACTYNPPPKAHLEAGEGNRITVGDPLVLRFSEPICPATLEVRVWSGRKDLYDLEGGRVPWDRPILEGCTLGMSPCRAVADGDDHDPAVNPRAREVCGNGLDDNSDGRTDEQDCEACFFLDQDGDGVGVASEATPCKPAEEGAWTARRAGDCDDRNPDVHPGATEVCNGADDDCDATADEPGAEGCATYFLDHDGDGWGVEGREQCRCSAGSGYVGKARDCDDQDPGVHPEVDEACNGRDDDCDGIVDRSGCKACTATYLDLDGDGWGLSTDSKCLVEPEGHHTAVRGGDCDDQDAGAHPGAAEVCNGRDDDCDARTDEGHGLPGCVWFHEDADGDGYAGDASRCLCAPEAPFTAGEVAMTLDETRTLATLDVAPGALGPLAEPLVLEVTDRLADASGHPVGYSQVFDFQVMERQEAAVACREDAGELTPYDVTQGAFLFFAHFASPPSPIELNQQFFCDIAVNARTGRFVILCTDADPLPGAPLNTKDPAELKMDTGVEGFIFTLTGCLGQDESQGYVFEAEPFTLALTIGPITFALRDTVLSGRIGSDPGSGAAQWDGTMAVRELYMSVAGQETVYPASKANFQMAQVPQALIPDGMPRACDADPCSVVGGSCDLLTPWPVPEVCGAGE